MVAVVAMVAMVAMVIVVVVVVVVVMVAMRIVVVVPPVPPPQLLPMPLCSSCVQVVGQLLRQNSILSRSLHGIRRTYRHACVQQVT